MRKQSNMIELLASYQEGRSQCLKNSRGALAPIGLDDYFCPGEVEDFLHKRHISRYISHCNFAIESLGTLRGDLLNKELLSILTEQEQQVINMRVENKLGFLEISVELGCETTLVKEIYKNAKKKLTSHLRSSLN